jgi:Fumarylacetoacetate (FAA) hydrolase family
MELSIRTVLDGKERQNYPVGDMIFPPHRLVSFLSRDMTLLPGDVIACGTSVGVGAMRGASNAIEVSIEGVGTLSNTFAQQVPFRYGEGPPQAMRVCVVGARRPRRVALPDLPPRPDRVCPAGLGVVGGRWCSPTTEIIP